MFPRGPRVVAMSGVKQTTSSKGQGWMTLAPDDDREEGQIVDSESSGNEGDQDEADVFKKPQISKQKKKHKSKSRDEKSSHKKKKKDKVEKKKSSWMTLGDDETEKVETKNSWYGLFQGSKSDKSSKKKEEKQKSWYDLPEEVIGSFGLRGIGREASVRPESPPPRDVRPSRIPHPRTPSPPRSSSKLSKHSSSRDRSPVRSRAEELELMNPIGPSKKSRNEQRYDREPRYHDEPFKKPRMDYPQPAYGRPSYRSSRDDDYYRHDTRSHSPPYRNTSPPARRIYRYYETEEMRERDRRKAARAPSIAKSEVSVSTVRTSRSRRSGRSCSRARRIYTEDEKIDKAKLLSIARENLMRMVDSGTLPKGIDINRFKLKHLRELKDAKSIQEWTEFCRAISAMEAAAYSDSSLSGSDIDSDDDIKSVISEVTFKGRHPFVIKPKPEIIVKVRDFVTLKTRDATEVQKDLRESFPVSSGDRHRAIEWKHISNEMGPPKALPPKKPITKVASEQPDDSVTYLRARMEAEGLIPDGKTSAEKAPENVFPEVNEPKIEIGTVMAQRLAAMRVLQNDPMNVVALKQMQDAQEMMDAWSKQCVKPGQWVGQTGAKIMSTEELHSAEPGYQAWLKPDALKNAVAIDGGIGKFLLKKMGWTDGKGLGRNEDGPLDPVLPVLKFDTSGLRAEDEVLKKLSVQIISENGVQNLKVEDIETPITRLGKYCIQQGLALPFYEEPEMSGPPHKPNFICKVKVRNTWYQPTVSVRTKREAKHLAASVCLQALGLLPRDL